MYLAGGMAEDDILRDFAALSRDDIRAALEFAAARTPGLMKGRIRAGKDFDAPLPGAVLDAFEGKTGSR